MKRLVMSAGLCAALIIPLFFLAAAPPQTGRLAGFTTRLAGRTSAQRHNAVRAAALLDGAVIPANGTFSFNGRVKGWEPERGFVRAPVSYDGALIPAFGGGVCQVSTTLYNAALLAGLGIAERHPHTFAPRYVSPGRDAAVALPGVDLRLTNPYPFPLRIRARADGNQLTAEIWGKNDPIQKYAIEIQTSVLNESRPVGHWVMRSSGRQEAVPMTQSPNAPMPHRLRPRPMTGYRVITYRLIRRPGRTPVRERLSDDSYVPSG